MRGAAELPNGESAAAALRRAALSPYLCRAILGWRGELVVADLRRRGARHEFEEPAPLVLPSGRVLLLLRDNASRILHAVHSDDGGAT